MKNIINTIILGIKIGISIDTLPLKVRNLIEKPFSRLLRVIGGICLLLILSGIYEKFDFPFIWVILILGLSQSLFMVIINFTKFFYGTYIFFNKPELFEVKIKNDEVKIKNDEIKIKTDIKKTPKKTFFSKFK